MINRKTIITIILGLLTILSCRKNATYKADVLVLDFYTGQALASQPVVMSKCVSGIMGFGSCDPYTKRLTNNSGIARFSEEIEFGTLTNYGFHADIANGFMGTEMKKTVNNSKDTLWVKELENMDLELSITTILDSLRLFVYCFDFEAQTLSFKSGTNIFTEILVTPEENNALRIVGYLNGNEIDDKLIGFEPKYGVKDSLFVQYP